MKQITLSITFCLAMSYAVFAQKISTSDLPLVVGESFKTKFSIAEKATWSLDYDNYKAEFKVGKLDFAASFDKDGKWLKTETFLKPSDLPKVVKDVLVKEFGELSAYKIEDPEKIETPVNGIVYQMEVEKGFLNYHILVSEKGELLKKEEVEENKKY